MTLISIIQGVAFGILINEGIPIIRDDNISKTLLIFPAMSLFGIILVFYFYSWFVSVIYAPPSLMESTVPIVLATSETLPMFFFKDPELWWFFIALFCLCGVIGFGNTLLHLHKDNYEDTDNDGFSDAYKVFRDELFTNIVFCFVMAGIAFSAWAIHPSGYNEAERLPTSDIIFAPIFFLVMIAFGVTSSSRFLRKILELGGFLSGKK